MTPDTALTTLEAVKLYLGGRTGALRDEHLSALVARKSAEVSVWCGRRFVQTTHTEYYDGNGSDQLYLRHYPITTPLTGSQGIWEDAARQFATAVALIEDTNTTTGDFRFDRGGEEEGQGIVVRVNGIWQRGRQNYKVVYQAGYATIPGTVVEAVHRLIAVAFFHTENNTQAVVSQTNPAGGGSVNVVEHGIPKDVRELLAPYRWVGW